MRPELDGPNQFAVFLGDHEVGPAEPYWLHGYSASQGHDRLLVVATAGRINTVIRTS